MFVRNGQRLGSVQHDPEPRARKSTPKQSADKSNDKGPSEASTTSTSDTEKASESKSTGKPAAGDSKKQ